MLIEVARRLIVIRQVEFKSVPEQRTTVTGGSDPRTATSLLLFEEFVPLEYRASLASNARSRFPLFQTKSSKQWKQAATVNGKPYVPGLVPESRTLHEVEFDTLIRSETPTKVISLARGAAGTVKRPGTAGSTMSVADPPQVSTAVPPVPPLVQSPVRKESLPTSPLTSTPVMKKSHSATSHESSE